MLIGAPCIQMDENYNLRWNDYEKGLLGGFSSIRENRELFDISLMCEDTVLQVRSINLSFNLATYCNI